MFEKINEVVLSNSVNNLKAAKTLTQKINSTFGDGFKDGKDLGLVSLKGAGTAEEIIEKYKTAKEAYEKGLKNPNTPEGHKKLENDYLEAKRLWQLGTTEGIQSRYKDAKKTYEADKNSPNTPEGHKKIEQEYENAKKMWQIGTYEGAKSRYIEAKKIYSVDKKQSNTPEGHQKIEQEYLEAKTYYENAEAAVMSKVTNRK